ncbi:hypothetical protein I4F81_008618 [Pyropia yezoensis]|uniref:Uncharacterized protein n=1 Tax=Pyropia yezoensis TaxID=2788 RepID=A0ACC3C892_PYRYE|nr:hypothetical protein I4F81_008618 [Neopyropia yezoensis]
MAAWATAAGFFLLGPDRRGRDTFWRWTDAVGAAAGAATAAAGVFPPRSDRLSAPLTAVDAADSRGWLLVVGLRDAATPPLFEWTAATGTWAWLAGGGDRRPRDRVDDGSGPPSVGGAAPVGEAAGPAGWSTRQRRRPPFVYHPARNALYLVQFVPAQPPQDRVAGSRPPRAMLDVRVWAYDLATDGWAVVVAAASEASGGPPLSDAFYTYGLAAAPAGTGLAVWRQSGFATTTLDGWRLDLDARPPAWTSLPTAGATIAYLLQRQPQWIAPDGGLLIYAPGTQVPYLNLGREPPPSTPGITTAPGDNPFGDPPLLGLTNVDRFVRLGTAVDAGADVAAERAAVPAGRATTGGGGAAAGCEY